MFIRRCRIGCVLLFLTANLVQAKDEIPVNLIAGKQVEPDAKLKKGDKLVGVFEKKNYLVEVVEVKPNNRLRIVWVESKDFDDDTAPNELYYIGEANQTRRSRTAVLPEAYRSRDKNGDGQIGLYEWERSKFAEFRKLDKNHDGFLTPQELIVKGPAVATTATTPAAATTDSKEKSAPVNLIEYNGKVNESFTFTITGKTSGGVWGSNPYATDSDLAAAAVHAGVMKDGATGTVVATIVAPANEFAGSVKNGVTSVDRKEVGPAFIFKSP